MRYLSVFFAVVMMFASCKSGNKMVAGSDDNSNTFTKRPNVVLIYADDMGWGDVSYNGRKDTFTPNIDKIAGEGVVFSQGYVSASVCGPSRSGMITGVYQQRFGCGENMSMAGYPKKMKFPKAGVPSSQTVFPEMMKQRNYNTAMFGKWHLGAAPELTPNGRGFDEYYGFLNGAHDYYEAKMPFGRNKGKWPLFENREVVKQYNGEYFTDLFSRKAVEYVDKVAGDENPFFVYLAYNAVHHPWQVTQEYLDRIEKLIPNATEDKKVFSAMVMAMDDGIGRLLNKIKEKGQEENTVVIFVSDNGSPRGQGLKPTKKDAGLKYGNHQMSSPGPFRGFKGDTFEGGVRVPFVIKWPVEIKPGTVYDHPVSTIDLMPTIAAYLKIHPKSKKGFAYDGVDLLPFIKGLKANERPHEILYWRRDDDYAIRKGDWKLSFNNHSVGSLPDLKKRTKKTIYNAGKRELFDLSKDKEERYDLSAKYPKIVKELQHEFDLWDTTLPDNEWWGGSFNRKKKYK